MRSLLVIAVCGIAVMAAVACTLPAPPPGLAADARVDTLPAEEAPHRPELPAGAAESVVLCFGGDVMPGTNYPDGVGAKYIPREDIWEHVRPVLQRADLSIVNLETAVLDSGGRAKECRDPALCYVFRTPPRLLEAMKRAGVDCVGIANNHTNDMGREGRAGTVSALRALGIAFAGHAPGAETCIVERRGLRIGYAAFATSPGTPSVVDIPAARRLVGALRRRCDILVVGFHGGAEGRAFTHVPDSMEIFAEERRGHVRAFAHAVVDAGADVVVGHGPHVPRALERYRGRLIAYSLGNFVTPHKVSLAGVSGLAPLLEVRLGADGSFLEGRIHSFRQRAGRGPMPDASAEAARLVGALTANDIEDPGLSVGSDGAIVCR